MRKLKILVCDDSLLIRKKTIEKVKKLGDFEIFEAKDGAECVEISKNEQPDVVLLDIVMPNKTGVEALVEILEDNPKTSVVMITSVGTKENLKECLSKGAVDFIQKPLEDSKVKDVIEKVIRNKEGELK